MDFWTPQHLATLCHGRWHESRAAPQRPITGVSIDSRTLQPGELFFAIRGETFDGHDYVHQALSRGAVAGVVEHLPSHATSSSDHAASQQSASPCLVVDNVTAALQRLAAAWREELKAGGCRVVAVCGSNGKTTTRHLIHHLLLSAGRSGTQSPKSFNNHLGVPLTLLAAKAEHDFVAVEVGTNHPGEVAALGAIVRPDIVVLTNIGEEHLEFFGDLMGVAKEEVSLLSFLQTDGVGLLPADEADWPLTQEVDLPLPVDATLALFDRHDPIARAVALPGEHNIANAAAAAAVARLFKIDDAQIAEALRHVQAMPGRTQIIELGRNTLLLQDAYNANPTSMTAALTLLQTLAQGRRKVAILSDMLELGEHQTQAHARLMAEATAQSDVLITIGPQLAAHRDQAASFTQYDDQLPQQVAALLQPGDAILLKGSRGWQLERLVPAIIERFNQNG